MEQFTGRVWVLGDDIDTDIIIPTEYLALKTIEDMKQYGFSPLRPELAGQIQPGDMIVAGKNFGCGSSREQAPEVIKALGIRCIIARSFARIFFRNSINNGLLLIEQPDLRDAVEVQTSKFISGSPPKKSTSRLRRVPEFSMRKSSARLPVSKLMRPASPWNLPCAAKQ